VSRLKAKPPNSIDQLVDRQLKELLTAYVDRGATGGSITDQHLRASQQLDDLAMHDPERFWRFTEMALASSLEASALAGLGAGPLTWLLRWHPDDFDSRVAGMMRASAVMRTLVAEMDAERIAPDVWMQLEAVRQA
jgi:hypothetical protein